MKYNKSDFNNKFLIVIIQLAELKRFLGNCPAVLFRILNML